MNSFKSSLEKKLLQSRYNNFGLDNYDIYRFGVPKVNEKLPGTFKKAKDKIKKIIHYKNKQFLNSKLEKIVRYEKGLEKIYQEVDNCSKGLLIDLIAYRLLGYRKVKLPRNNKEYWDAVKVADSLTLENESYETNLLHFGLSKFDLKKAGYDILLYFSTIGVVIDFIFEQYTYRSFDRTIVGVESGDIVLDLGACWGDTALYFATKAGEKCKVYSFEFIPENIKLFNLNVSLNPNLSNQIELIQNPVSSKSNEKVYFKDKGPSSRVEFEPFSGQTGITSSISIDDFVREYSINKVDFIKMDIEGAESSALEGAIETIRKFKPKLAIAIYHSMDDFISIPEWILGLNIGYKLFLDHYTIHSEETILFAKVEA